MNDPGKIMLELKEMSHRLCMGLQKVILFVKFSFLVQTVDHMNCSWVDPKSLQAFCLQNPADTSLFITKISWNDCFLGFTIGIDIKATPFWKLANGDINPKNAFCMAADPKSSIVSLLEWDNSCLLTICFPISATMIFKTILVRCYLISLQQSQVESNGKAYFFWQISHCCRCLAFCYTDIWCVTWTCVS